MATPRATTYPAASSDGVFAGIPRPAGFAPGSVVGGSYNSSTNTWTPERDGSGVVKEASWAEVPAEKWTEVAGGNLDALTSAITAAGWDAGNLAWAGVMQAWNGFAVDTAGSRVWLVCAGGHNDSSNNGIYRFDCFKMRWTVEQQPSDRTAWSTRYLSHDGNPGGSFTACPETGEAVPQAGLGEEAATATPIKNYYDRLLWDNRPTSRHQYASPAYDPVGDRLIFGCRSVWVFDRASQTWTMNYRWDQAMDGADISGYYDENTGEYLMAGNGDGLNTSRAFNLGTRTFAAWATSWIGDPWPDVGEVRHGREITVWSQPHNDRTASYYSKYSLDSRSATISRTQVTMDSSIAASEFPSKDSLNTGSPPLVYIPSLNEYWTLVNLTASGMTFLALDPTTTPWTLKRKTLAGAVPVSGSRPCRKMVFMPNINAVLLSAHESHTYVYKF